MNQPILIVISLATGELPLTRALLAHLTTFGQIQHHAVLFVADNGMPEDVYQPILDAAKPIFPAGGSLIHTALSLKEAYPQAHNLRFETALRHVSASIKSPFLFLSPRCVPTRPGWLLELETEYNAHAKTKPILGQLLTPETHGTAHPLVPSTAIYAPNLPKRVMQLLIAQRGVDFEKSCASEFVPLTHPTKLIWNHALDGTSDLPSPPSVASLVHTARSREYALVIQGKAAPPPKLSEPAIVPIAEPQVVVPVVKRDEGKRITVARPAIEPARTAYYHSGDLGDIIYALAAIRLAGGGKLLLGPRSLRTPPPANPMREDQFERLQPLLESQPYISKAQFTERYPGTDTAFDLNRFRENWGDKGLRERTGISTLVRMHCHLLGVDEKFHPGDIWLTVPNVIETGMFTCHRSARYRSTEDDPFPWELIVKRYAKRLLFVGLPSEHAEFQRQFDCKVSFWQCVDFLEMARVIAGSNGFIGNQSFPNAIALGCGQRVAQEVWPTSPDCVFARPNFIHQPLSEAALKRWEESPTPLENVNIRIETVVPIDEKKPVSLSLPNTVRLVSTDRCLDGRIELGPQENAFGLGDTLAITPLAAQLGQRAVMCLPKDIERFSPLFDGLCDVKITDQYPVFPNPGNGRFIESKLRMFGYQCEDGKTVPKIVLKHGENVNAGKWASALRSRKPLLAFHTSCASKWAHVRSRPVEWFAPIKLELENHFTLITEDESNPTPLRTLAARYKKIGLYFGVNTGNWHLAMAVGCKCLVIDADECDGYNPALWRYSLPTCEYVGFDVGNVLAKIPWLLK